MILRVGCIRFVASAGAKARDEKLNGPHSIRVCEFVRTSLFPYYAAYS
jgi:hypothetical protein